MLEITNNEERSYINIDQIVGVTEISGEGRMKSKITLGNNGTVTVRGGAYSVSRVIESARKARTGISKTHIEHLEEVN